MRTAVRCNDDWKRRRLIPKLSTMTTRELTSAALALSKEERAELVERLARSLEEDESQLSPEQWRKAWGEELNRRVAAVNDGSATLIDEARVWADAEALLAEPTH